VAFTTTVVLIFMLTMSFRPVDTPEPLPTKAVFIPAETSPPSPQPIYTTTNTPQTSFDTNQISLQVDERFCSLNEVAFYGLSIYQADCGEEIFMVQGEEITLTLLTPNGDIYPISLIPNQAAIFGALEPPFVYGEYVQSDKPNTVVCAIPMFEVSGDPILCGFSIPFNRREVIVVVTGLTTRKNSTNE